MTPIEAVSVCVNYGDILREVAPFNRPLLSRWIVITTPQDELTRSVCRRFSIECVTTEEHKRDGSFAKGRMIDRALSHIEGSDWILHLDADVALPVDFHSVLDDAHLDESCVYGCDRLNVTGMDNWKRVKEAGLVCRPNGWGVNLDRPNTSVGTRVANSRHGYTPIGFFQLWHADASHWQGQHTRNYPHKHGTAARTDVQHTLQWDRRKRVLIPELLVWHLETERAPMGANWSGRTTKPLGCSEKTYG